MPAGSFDRRYPALGALALLATCRAASPPRPTIGLLPVTVLSQPAPVCGSAPIMPRSTDATATYFACQVDRVIVLERRAALQYPSLLASANVEGTAELQFAVDPSGTVDTTTIVVLQSTHELLTKAARQALLGSSWRPQCGQASPFDS